MVKRKQNTIKKVALAAILSFFLTSAASTITANASEPIQNNINDGNQSDEQTIANAKDGIEKFFGQLNTIEHDYETAKQGKKNAEAMNKLNEAINNMLQEAQKQNNVWGPIFLLKQLDILKEIKYATTDLVKTSLPAKILQKQKEFENPPNNSKTEEVSADAKIISQLRNKEKGILDTNALTSAIFCPDEQGKYKTLNELIQLLGTKRAMSPQNPTNQQTHTVIKQLYLWFRILTDFTFTFPGISNRIKGQLLALEFAYQNELLKTTDNKGDEQTLQLLEKITQLHANTITKIIIDLGYKGKKPEIPFPELQETKETQQPTN